MIVPTWEFWARQFCKQLSLDCTLEGENMIAVLAWMRTENTTAQWNPLATTLPWPGSVDLKGSIGNTQQYITFCDGMQANIHTIQNGLYETILWPMRGGATADAIASQITRSQWGTKIDPSTVTWVRKNYRIIADRPLNSPFPKT